MAVVDLNGSEDTSISSSYILMSESLETRIALCNPNDPNINVLDCVRKNFSMDDLIVTVPNGTNVSFDWSLMGDRQDPYAVPMTIVYMVILITGIVGNICTCIVIARNRYMHTATNYYLFSLAVSDLLLLVLGLPQEIYHLWSRYPYIFGEAFCIIRGWSSETSTNASILTITAFTVERYLAICHPLRAHTMSRLSRAIKFIIAIWICAALSAISMGYQLGIIYEKDTLGHDVLDTATCSVKRSLDHAFEWSIGLFFFFPGTLLCILYALIGLQLRKSTDMGRKHDGRCLPNVNGTSKPQGKVLNAPGKTVCRKSSTSSRKDVIKMLVAVVIAFFLCWAPFHAQRLMAIYVTEPTDADFIAFSILTNISGVCYYISATINPILYSIMSLKFRHAFRDTLARCLGRGRGMRHRDRNRTMSLFNSTVRSAGYEFTDLTIVSEVGHPTQDHIQNQNGSHSSLRKSSRLQQLAVGNSIELKQLQNAMGNGKNQIQKKMSTSSNAPLKINEAFDVSSICDYIDQNKDVHE